MAFECPGRSGRGELMYNDELTHYAIAKSRDSQYAVAYDDEYLEHHGVKGQKWGVRKQKPTGNVTNSRKGLTKGAKIALGVGAGVLGTAALSGMAMRAGVNPIDAASSAGKAAYKVAKSTVKAAKTAKATKAAKVAKETYFNKSAKKSAKVFESAARKKAVVDYAKDMRNRTLQSIKEQGSQRAAGIVVGIAAVPIANLGARAQRAGNEWINERLGR